MLIRGANLLNSRLEIEYYLRYLRGKEWYDLVRKESWHHGAEYTWEREDQFKTKYPHLFASTMSAVAS
ncbi:hypothetical protein Tco_0060738 [Tanacetum coccineum]